MTIVVVVVSFFYRRITTTIESGPLDNWLDQLNCRDGKESSLDECRTQNVGIASIDCAIQGYVAISCVRSKQK